MQRQGKALAAGIALFALALAWAPAAGADADVACTGDGVVATDGTRAQVELSLLCLINRYRADNALQPLSTDTRLSAAALAHSDNMNSQGYFDHVNPGDPLDTPAFRATSAGYLSPVGENLASNGASGPFPGKGTAYSLFDDWRHSPLHNGNILTKDYVASGLGVDPGCWCGGANFGLVGDGIGATGTQMFGVGPANSGETGLSLNFGPIPGSILKSGNDKKKTTCKKKKHGKKKKKKKCKKKRKGGKK